MADALISAAVGGTALALAAGAAAVSGRHAAKTANPEKVALTGVAGAFVFAAQMINFAIPGTGSSGHLVGGILLASLLGPYAGFLALCAVLLIQALFFGDGGLLALGCNIINMGVFSCLIAYPLIFRPLVRASWNRGRIIAASILAAVAGLQMGAFAVVLETLLSGRTQLPFGAFTALMQPIHLAIGFVEGVITAAILLFIRETRPELLDARMAAPDSLKRRVSVPLLLLAAAIALSAGLFWFASGHPDGLEWAISKVIPNGGLDWNFFKGAWFADYGSQNGTESFAGVVGTVMTLALIILAALLMRVAGKAISRAKAKKHADKS